MTDVAIVGAGPYGLSLAAHLKALNVDFEIFGFPMATWTNSMPRGMRLKSEGFASNLYDPDGALTLSRYCADNGLPYADIGIPVPIETFCAYGRAFQAEFAPKLVQKSLVELSRQAAGWRLKLDDGSVTHARRVVLATGIDHFKQIAPEVAGLDARWVSHSGDHADLSRFAGKEVVVIGSGASALDAAAILLGKGAGVTVVCRASKIWFHNPPRKRTLIDELRAPMTGIGPNWRSFACVHAPLLFHALPEELRLKAVANHLGPAPGWFIRKEVEGKAPMLLETNVADAVVEGGRLRVTLERSGEANRTIHADHIISATGYPVDLTRLEFLGEDLRSRIRLTGRAPALDSNFQSSEPGLYFVGAASANSFGPMVRFAFGAGFTSRRLSRTLARTAARRSVASPSRAAGMTASA
jgi:cation diffusion facilitator CzcD-associated flavoprotein CzcO